MILKATSNRHAKRFRSREERWFGEEAAKVRWNDRESVNSFVQSVKTRQEQLQEELDTYSWKEPDANEKNLFLNAYTYMGRSMPDDIAR